MKEEKMLGKHNFETKTSTKLRKKVSKRLIDYFLPMKKTAAAKSINSLYSISESPLGCWVSSQLGVNQTFLKSLQMKLAVLNLSELSFAELSGFFYPSCPDLK